MTPKRNLKVSLFALLKHEVFVAARTLIFGGKQADDIHLAVGKRVSEDAKSASKLGIALIVGAVLISNAGASNTFDMNLGTVKVSLPSAYLACLAAFSFAGMAHRILRIFVFIAAREELPYSSFGRTRFADAKRALLGDEHYDVLVQKRGGHFVRIVGGIGKVLTYSLLLVFAALLIPTLGAYALVFGTGLEAILRPNEIYLSRPLGIVTIVLLSVTVIYCVAFFVPTKVVKDKQYVRWNFLVRVTNQNLRLHPQARRWLKDEGR